LTTLRGGGNSGREYKKPFKEKRNGLTREREKAPRVNNCRGIGIQAVEGLSTGGEPQGGRSDERQKGVEKKKKKKNKTM